MCCIAFSAEEDSAKYIRCVLVDSRFLRFCTQGLHDDRHMMSEICATWRAKSTS